MASATYTRGKINALTARERKPSVGEWRKQVGEEQLNKAQAKEVMKRSMNISVPTAAQDHNRACEAKCRPLGCTSDNELQIVVQMKKQADRNKMKNTAKRTKSHVAQRKYPRCARRGKGHRKERREQAN